MSRTKYRLTLVENIFSSYRLKCLKHRGDTLACHTPSTANVHSVLKPLSTSLNVSTREQTPLWWLKHARARDKSSPNASTKLSGLPKALHKTHNAVKLNTRHPIRNIKTPRTLACTRDTFFSSPVLKKCVEEIARVQGGGSRRDDAGYAPSTFRKMMAPLSRRNIAESVASGMGF